MLAFLHFICIGKFNDNRGDEEKLTFLSNTRTHEVKECLEKHFASDSFGSRMNHPPCLQY